MHAESPMKSVLLHEVEGLRTFAIVLSTGDEVVATLEQFASEQQLNASRHRPIDEQVEVLSLLGDITRDGDGHTIHAHVVIGKADATAHTS
jgi:uncharacterized protein